MTCFYQASSLGQSILLIISQFAMISLTVGFILLLKRKCKLSKLIGTGAIFLLNVALYVLMQLDSRMTGAEQGLHLHVPYAVLMLVTLTTIAVNAWLVLSETKNRKTINNTSIKEAFDNLPTGVCFFNEAGLPVLCNHTMQRFSFAVCGKDVQLITDLENCLADDFIPADDVRKDGKVFILSDGSAWHLEKRTFTHESGNMYTQYIATDVSELHKNRVELTQENEQLRKVQADLKKLSANIVAVTREEEILNTKMRVHDEMGRCLVEAQKFLRDGCNESIPDSVISSWQRAVSMIKYSNETVDEDMLSQVRKTCASVGIAYVQTGELPTEESTAYTLICAVRECVTNAVRYAGASELYVQFSETEKLATVTITNNGKRPDSPIVEGGGLSTLRRRVERAGGVMVVQSFPVFKLTVTVPKEKEGVL
jgi:anti-sigma regulatory factor (Ser/Thr protein kinase)